MQMRCGGGSPVQDCAWCEGLGGAQNVITVFFILINLGSESNFSCWRGVLWKGQGRTSQSLNVSFFRAKQWRCPIYIQHLFHDICMIFGLSCNMMGVWFSFVCSFWKVWNIEVLTWLRARELSRPSYHSVVQYTVALVCTTREERELGALWWLGGMVVNVNERVCPL